jgi:uncharacterized protein YoxC
MRQVIGGTEQMMEILNNITTDATATHGRASQVAQAATHVTESLDQLNERARRFSQALRSA